MADSDVFPVDSQLVIMEGGDTDYDVDGTLLGLMFSSKIVRFNLDVELLSKPFVAGTTPTDARLTGSTTTIEFILAERSTNVLNLLFADRVSGVGSNLVRAMGDLKLGKLAVGEGLTKKLLVRPIDSAGDIDPTNPNFCFFPRALVIDVGQITYDREGEMLSGTSVQIVGLFDDSFPTADQDSAYWGLSSDLPSLS